MKKLYAHALILLSFHLFFNVVLAMVTNGPTADSHIWKFWVEIAVVLGLFFPILINKYWKDYSTWFKIYLFATPVIALFV